MFEWDDLRCLLAVHRTGSFAAASASLGVNPTTVSRRMATLQEALGATLLSRKGRHFVLTEAGLRLLEHAERMEESALALERSVGGDDQRLSGLVRLSITEMLATRFLAPQLYRFSARYPEIELHVSTSREVADLDRREADVALRLTRPQSQDLVIRRLLNVELGLFVGRRYVDRLGKPPALGASFAGHDLLAFARTRAFRRENDWLEAHLPEARVAFRTDSVSSLYAAAVGGMGIALLPWMVASQENHLVPLQVAEGLEPRKVWQLVHKDLQHAARIRVLLDFLAEVMGRAQGK